MSCPPFRNATVPGITLPGKIGHLPPQIPRKNGTIRDNNITSLKQQSGRQRPFFEGPQMLVGEMQSARAQTIRERRGKFYG